MVATVLKNHPPECIFAEGAFERIVAKLEEQNDFYAPNFIDIFEAAVKAEEIYCPHEGIDKRVQA